VRSPEDRVGRTRMVTVEQIVDNPTVVDRTPLPAVPHNGWTSGGSLPPATPTPLPHPVPGARGDLWTYRAEG